MPNHQTRFFFEQKKANPNHRLKLVVNINGSVIYSDYISHYDRGFFLGASPRTHEKVKVKSNMPALHWSSPGSGGPSTVVLFVFLEGGPSKVFFWQGEAVLYVFLSARLKTRDRWSHFNPNLQNKGTIPKQHASCNNFLGSPPLQTTIFDWFRDISWIQITREKKTIVNERQYMAKPIAFKHLRSCLCPPVGVLWSTLAAKLWTGLSKDAVENGKIGV